MNTKITLFIAIVIFYTVAIAGSKLLITPEKLAPISGISNPQFSPDGKWIAFDERKAITLNIADSLDRDIWIVPSDGSAKPRRLAFGPYQEFHPLWSPDGKYVAFLSNRAQRNAFQIYLLNMAGGEAVQITKEKQGVIDFKWLADSQTIAFTARISSKSDLGQKHNQYGDVVEVDKSVERVRLYELNLKTKTVKPLTEKNEHVIGFDYSHKNDRIAVNLSSSADEDNVYFHSELAIMDRDGSNRMKISGKEDGIDLRRCLWAPKWSPDDRKIIYFVPAASSYLPAVFSTVDNKARLLAEEFTGTIWYMNWNPVNSEIIVMANKGVQTVIGKLNEMDDKVKVIKKVGTPYCEVQTFTLSSDGKKITFHAPRYNHPDDIWIMNTDGSALRRLTKMNPSIESLSTVTQEVIRWKNKDGVMIEGLLFKPQNYDEKKRYPTVVDIHGGPTWAWWNGWLAGWHEWGQLLSNYGFVVLMPNPRGSNGYGLKFSKANFNDWGAGPLEDVMSGIDYLIQKGISDSTRLGIGGWSYGGYLSAWTITQTHRFKAAVLGASVTDLITMRSTCGRPENFDLFFGGNPLQKEDIYRANSPVTFVKNVTTPTLILHGENDNVVPIAQSYEFYQLLKDTGVKTEFVIYPRESHGIDEMAHQIDLMHRLIDWFSHYLKDDNKNITSQSG